MAAKVFISYRRDDARHPAGRIYEAIERVLPSGNLFMDVDSIPPGVDFVEFLESWVDQCDIMLALIGTGWVGSIDPKTNQARLHNPSDFVRIEVREALLRGIPVVPVLVDGASMPAPEGLPDDIKALARRQAEFVEFRTFNADVERLIRRLRLADTIPQPRAAPSAGARRFDPVDVPSLTFTRLLRASFAGRELLRPTWNGLVRAAHEVAFSKVKNFDELRLLTPARIVRGTKTDEGYSPLGELGFSIQGVDSQDAWRIAFAIARKLPTDVAVTFRWQEKEGAAFPGEVGTADWSPSRGLN